MTALDRRSFLAGLAGLAAAPILAACGDDGDDDATPSTRRSTSTSEETTTTPPPPPVAPLTGLPFTGDAAVLQRPALAVKISNADGGRTHNARPQAGFNQADVVAEILTEGGVTRFLAIFHSQDAAQVGPVRSFRTSELDLLPALGLPLFAYSGANASFLARLRESGRVVDVGYDAASGAYQRVPGRVRDQSLFTSTAALWQAGAGQGTPPPPWFAYREDPAAPPGAGARPAAGVAYTMPGAAPAPVEYGWDGRAWARFQKGTPHVDTDGVQAAPANVVVQFVEYRDTGARDSVGTPVPEAVLIGDGEAWVLSGGQVVEGRWWKPDPATPTSYTDQTGQPILFAPGTTWIAYVPPGTAQLR